MQKAWFEIQYKMSVLILFRVHVDSDEPGVLHVVTAMLR